MCIGLLETRLRLSPATSTDDAFLRNRDARYEIAYGQFALNAIV